MLSCSFIFLNKYCCAAQIFFYGQKIYINEVPRVPQPVYIQVYHPIINQGY